MVLGKGAPDGIGGALKRKADRIVKIMGQYISDALDYKVLQSQNTQVVLHRCGNH